MSRLKNQKTFQQDGWKRIFCRNCGNFLCESHLGEKNIKTKTCKKCKNIQIIAPPRFGTFEGKQGFFWAEPSNSCFTAD